MAKRMSIALRVLALVLIFGWLLFQFGLGGVYRGFFEAVEAGEVAQVRIMVQGNPELLKLKKSSVTLLQLAAQGGHPDMARYLISVGSDVDEPGGRERSSPLITASARCHSETAAVLLAAGANIEFRNKKVYNETALMVAVARCPPSIVSLLLRHGADVNAQNADHKTPLEIAAVSGGTSEVIRTLLEADAKIPDDLITKLKGKRGKETGEDKRLDQIIAILESWTKR